MLRGILRRRALWILLGAIAVSALISGGAIRLYWWRSQELKDLERRRVDSQVRVRSLEARRLRAEQDAEFIETVARRELGLIGKNEIEYRFVSPTSTAASKAGKR
ncbi:MAG: septum formation initiator family protein [Elusimicrobia bacterium]|nr:septum formation initiator family protein [Elusimicrobiota bacterium]